MNLKIGLRTKIMAVTLLIVFIIAVSGVVTVNKGIKMTGALLGNQALKAAETAFELIDAGRFKEMLSTEGDKHPYYSELQQKLSQVRLGLGLDYLYTMTRNENNEYIYLVDGMPSDAEDFSAYGDVEDEEAYFQNFDKALNGEIVGNDFAYSDSWGNLVSAYIPIKDENGSVIAFLGADLDATETLKIMNDNTLFMIIFIASMSLLGAFAALVITYKITSPLLELRNFSAKAVKGESVELLRIETGDEIGEVASLLNSRITAVRNLLNNIGQGFLTFGMNMLIAPEYSLECKNIFGADIESKRFTELIYPEDKEQQRFLESVLVKLLREKDQDKRTLYYELLSDEVDINGRNIKVEYKIIKGSLSEEAEEFMVILSDITDRKMLQDKMEKEKDTLKMVVKVTVNHNDFLECIREYKAFYSCGFNRILSQEKPNQDIIYEVFRNVHTFKGNFSQLDLNSVVRGLNYMEDQLSSMKNELFRMSKDELKEYLSGFDMEEWLEEDINVLKQVMGDQFLTRFMNMNSALLVDKNKLLELENKLLTSLSSMDCKVIMPEMRKLRSRKFKELVKAYPAYLEKLAERMDKHVRPMVISGGDFAISSDIYNDFIRSLTHVFRNAVDHGIEAADERVFKGKEEYGRVQCNISTTEDSIIIAVRDDGRGIDIDKIRKKAVEKGILDENTAPFIAKKDIINLIFLDDFSTKQQETEFSGRGVGLSAVKKEVEKIGGTIEVKTKSGVGTEFAFHLPLYKEINAMDISIDSIMQPLVNTTYGFITNTIYGRNNDREAAAAKDLPEVIMDRVLRLDRYTAFTDLKGVLSGRFVITFSEELAKSFTSYFIIGDYEKDCEEEYIEDSMAECLNTVLGNSIKLFPGLEELVVFSSPATMKSRNTEIKYPNGNVWTCCVNLLEGSFSISYVTNEYKSC
ncbi:MAG: ATP-binding protein [Bacillota bacterium]